MLELIALRMREIESEKEYEKQQKQQIKKEDEQHKFWDTQPVASFGL